MLALAPKDRGGTRLAKELAAFACHAADEPRRHHRICRLVRPPEPAGLGAAIEEGGPRHVDNLALCTQPGVFSWDRLDPGTALLLANLPPLKARGPISAAVSGSSPGRSWLARGHRADAGGDRSRAVEMAHRNVADPRATIVWADIRAAGAVPGSLDFVVMNPPFHDGGTEDQALGRTFIARAAEALRKGGTLWLVANAHTCPTRRLSVPRSATSRSRCRPGATGSTRRADEGGQIRPPRQAAGQSRLRVAPRDPGAGPRRRDPAGRRRAGGCRRPDRPRSRSSGASDRRRRAGRSAAGPVPDAAQAARRDLLAQGAGPLVYGLLPERWRRRDPPLSTVGRLDKETSGLLLLTDDGALLHRIIAPKANVAKRYRVTLDRPRSTAPRKRPSRRAR